MKTTKITIIITTKIKIVTIQLRHTRKINTLRFYETVIVSSKLSPKLVSLQSVTINLISCQKEVKRKRICQGEDAYIKFKSKLSGLSFFHMVTPYPVFIFRKKGYAKRVSKRKQANRKWALKDTLKT